MADKQKHRNVPVGLAYIADNIHGGDNILGLPRAQKAAWAKGVDFSSNRSTILFAGCGYQYSSRLEPLVDALLQADRVSMDPDLPIRMGNLSKKVGVDAAGVLSKMTSRQAEGDAPVLRDAVQVLKALGLEIGYLGEDEPCCGAPVYHIGLQKEFAARAMAVYSSLKAAGVRRIISIVPSCTYALASLSPRLVPGFDLEVKHFIQAVAERMGHLTFKYPAAVKVAYHDPCQLGRYMGLIEQPRAILRAVENVRLIEPEWTAGEWSTCCGGGGGFEVVFPDMSRTLAANRALELHESGAEVIVTQCPGCLMQLRNGLKEIKKTDVEVIDLATLLARSLPA